MKFFFGFVLFLLCAFYYYYFFFFNNSISSSIYKLPIRSEIHNCTFKNTNKVPIITDIYTLLRVLSTGLFSHNMNYFIILILVIKKRKLIYSSLIKFKIHSKLFKIISHGFVLCGEVVCLCYLIYQTMLRIPIISVFGIR